MDKICGNCKYFRACLYDRELNIDQIKDIYLISTDLSLEMSCICGINGEDKSFDETCDDYDEIENGIQVYTNETIYRITNSGVFDMRNNCYIIDDNIENIREIYNAFMDIDHEIESRIEHAFFTCYPQGSYTEKNIEVKRTFDNKYIIGFYLNICEKEE